MQFFDVLAVIAMFLLPPMLCRASAAEHEFDLNALMALEMELRTPLADIANAEDRSHFELAGEGRVIGTSCVSRQRRILPAVGYGQIVCLIGDAKVVESEPIRPPVARRLAEGYGLNFHAGLVENPALLFEDLATT